MCKKIKYSTKLFQRTLVTTTVYVIFGTRNESPFQHNLSTACSIKYSMMYVPA